MRRPGGQVLDNGERDPAPGPAETAAMIGRGAAGGAANRRRSDADRPAVGLRALIVEHEADRRDLVRAVLAVLGFEVRAVGDAPAALDLLVGWPADLVVLDLGLPRGSAWALRAALR